MYHFFKSSLQKDIIIPTTPEVYFLFVCLSLTYDLFTFTQRIYHEHGHIIYNLEKRMIYYNHDFKNIIDIFSNSMYGILLSSKTNHFGGYVCHRFILFSTSIMLLENTTY